MRQEVNLYLDEFTPKIKWCLFSHAALVTFVFFGVMSYYSFSVIKSSSALKNENKILTEKTKKIEGVDSSVGLIDLIVKKRERLESQVGNISKEVESKKIIKSVYESEKNVKGASFYDIFLSIANNSSSDLSITEVGIYSGGGEVIVNGLSKKKSSIPDYFGRLKEQRSFSMTNFGLLKIVSLNGFGLYQFSMRRANKKGNEFFLGPKNISGDLSFPIEKYDKYNE